MTTPTTVQVRLKLRQDTAANWTSVNPTLLAGELGRESDTGKIKIGDGSTVWASLAYQPFGGLITDANIAADAEIAVSKLADGAARQLLQTDAAGTGVEWTSNVDVPGTLDVTGAGTFDGNVTIQGDLTVNGTETIINTQTLEVEDKNIVIGKVDTPSDALADGGGITLKGTTDKTINWVDATDAWTSSEHIELASGKSYRINGTEVLSGTTLGAGVTGSSLTSVGTIGTGVWQGTAIDKTYLDSTLVSTGDTGTVTSTMILDGTIVDADVNASAAIAGTKISPDFGSQTITTTGVIRPALGTAASPSLTFTGDLDTGIYSPGADQVAVATNGAQRITVDASGRLLVGASSSSAITSIVAQGNSTNATGAGVLSLARGTSTISSGNQLGVIDFTDSSDNRFARIESVADAATGVGDYPGRLVFSTTADGASSPTERLRITSAGLVGIGTSSPTERLDLGGGVSDTINIRFAMGGNVATIGSTGSGVANGLGNLTFATRNGSFMATAMTIDGSQRVGIGVTSPGDTLTVEKNATSAAAGGLTLQSASSDASVLTMGVSTSLDSASIASLRTGTGTVRPLTFIVGTNSANERMRIDTSGRLLVGTSTAREVEWAYGNGGTPTFQVEGDDGASSQILITDTRSNGRNPSLAFAKTRNGAIVTSGDVLGSLSFFGDDGTDTRTWGGRITCEVDGTPGANDMPGRLVFSTTADGASSPTERMSITQEGFICANTNTRSLKANAAAGGGFKFAAASSATSVGCEGITGATATRFHIAFTNGNGIVGTISTNGTATAYNTSSDYRLKENVTSVTDGITRLQQLKPSRFNFIADPDTTVDGFLAHEAAEVVPECVTGTKDEVDEDGNPLYQGIDQSKLVPLLTAALQEAIGEIESLKARVAALESA